MLMNMINSAFYARRRMPELQVLPVTMYVVFDSDYRALTLPFSTRREAKKQAEKINKRKKNANS